MHTYKELLVGGRWTAPAGSDTIEVVSPHSLEVVGSVPDATPADVDAAVAAARASFDSGVWSARPPAERIAVLRKAQEAMAARLDELAELSTVEMGSPIALSKASNSGASLMVLSTILGIAEALPWEERRTGTFVPEVIVRREGVGVVAAIVPWNAPQFCLMTKLAPALVAGNSIVVKPSPEAPLDALALAQIFQEAGLPEGVLSVLPTGRETGEYLVTHPDVDKVAFTGSTQAGRRIGSLCGERLKRFSLELGGKSAAIFLEDVDLAVAVPGLKFASLANNGQACIAQTRILAPRSRYAETVDAIGSMMGKLVVGDPREETTEVGPLVAERQQRRVNGYIDVGTQEGARLVVGGTTPRAGLERGWYVEPTLFADVDNSMRIAREEIFGPVLTVIPYDSDDEAVRIANDSEYGLAGSVWTGDHERALGVARRIRTGTFGVNQYLMDFSAPFGGFKNSGIGRELGVEGLHSYIELKSIVPGS